MIDKTYLVYRGEQKVPLGVGRVLCPDKDVLLKDGAGEVFVDRVDPYRRAVALDAVQSVADYVVRKHEPRTRDPVGDYHATALQDGVMIHLDVLRLAYLKKRPFPSPPLASYLLYQVIPYPYPL